MADNDIKTRRQIAVSRQEKEQIRLIYTGLSIIVGLVLFVLAIGVIQAYFIEPNSTIAIASGKEITVQEYRDRVLYERFLLEEQYAQIAQQRQALAEQGNEQFVQFYDQIGNQVLQQRSIVDQQTIDQMILEKLIEDEAAKRDITVSEEEIDTNINKFLAGRAGGVTEASAAETVEARVNATATASQWTPTPTNTPDLEATSEITPVDTPVPAPTPTLNVIGDSALETQYSNWLKLLDEKANVKEEQYRAYVRMDVLSDKLRESIGSEISNMALQANARHILVNTAVEPQLDEEGNPIEVDEATKTAEEAAAKAAGLELAQELLGRLQSGEDFDELVSEYSDDTRVTSAELGFVTEGTFVPSVDEAIFSLPIGEISELVESQFGWHIIEVLERGERELPQSDYDKLRSEAFSEWLTTTRDEAKENGTVEDYWTADKAPRDEFFNR